LRYYTVGEETWKTTNTWPLPTQNRTKLFLNADNSLNPQIEKEGVLKYKIDYTASSGNTSRWNSVTQLFMNGPTNYANRAEEDKNYYPSPLHHSIMLPKLPDIRG
jgi:hypothetical protein